jgi:cation-transporting ATPase 13A2
MTEVSLRRWTHRLCEAWDGTRVLATGLDGTQTIVEIETVIEPGGCVERRTFVYRLVRYFEGPGGEFVPSLFDAKVGYSVLLKGAATGLSEAEVTRNKFYFGKNLADVPVKGYLSLLVDEILHPFYIFQVWSVVVWYLEPYIMYATAIAVISLVSALVSLFSARRNLENIRHMAHFVCPITVRRRIGSESAPPQCIEIDSTDLVPGDIVELSDNVVFPCDLVLCSGTCIVNESMLTGESLPVLKTSVPVHVGVGQEGTYSPSQDKRFTLFCGTKCMEARKQGKASPVLAMVLRTGFR